MNRILGSPCRYRIARFARCRRGNSAAEFALILPVLLLMVMGTMQMGMLMYSYNVMVSAARDAARALAVCTYTDVPTATAHIRSSLPPWVAPAAWTITPVIGSDVSVTISVDPAKAAILSYVPFNLSKLTTSIVMHKEPLAYGGGSC